MQSRQHGLHTASKFGLLLCQTQRGLDIHDHVFVSGARQALHQFFELRTLQSDFTETGIEQSDSGCGFVSQVLRVFGQAIGLHGKLSCIRALSGQLLLNQTEFLPQHDGQCQRKQGKQANKFAPIRAPKRT